MDGSALEEKSSFSTLDLSFTFELDWDIYTISTAVTVSNKIGTLIRLRLLFISINLYDHAQGTVVMCGLVLPVDTYIC